MGLKLQAEVGIESGQFMRGLESIHHGVEKTGEKIKESAKDWTKEFVIGAIGVASVGAAIEKTVESAVALVNEAKQMNMTVEQVQLLKVAAKEAGQEFDVVAKSIEKINEARAKALGGDRAARLSFQTLGINHQQLANNTGAEIFMAIGEKIKGMNTEQIAEPMKDVMGRGASEAVGVLKTDFEELQKTMVETGQVMSTETAAKLKVLAESFEMVGRILTAQLAPTIISLSQTIIKSTLQFAGGVARAIGWVEDMINQRGVLKTGEFAAKAVVQNEKDLIFNPIKKTFESIRDLVVGSARKVIGGDIKGAASGWLGGVGSSLSNLFSGSASGSDKIKGIADALGFDTSRAGKVGDAASKPYEDTLKSSVDAFDLAVKNAIQKKADFSKTGQNHLNLEARGMRESDSLIKTGNFLGSSRNVINSTQARLEAHAASTANNTKNALQILTEIKNALGTSGANYQGLAMTQADYPS